MFLALDLETTGLDERECSILEIALAVAADNLEIVDTFSSPVAPVFGTLEKMDPIVRTMHTDNGLLAEIENTARIRYEAGGPGIRRYEVEAQALAFLEKYPSTKNTAVVGNSVCFDKVFLREHMPRLFSYFHYRIIDVSSLNILAERWNKGMHNARPRTLNTKHRALALADALSSLDQLRYYRRCGLFMPVKPVFDPVLDE